MQRSLADETALVHTEGECVPAATAEHGLRSLAHTGLGRFPLAPDATRALDVVVDEIADKVLEGDMLRRAAEMDEDSTFFLGGGRWTCTNAHISTNMCYVYAENEEALALFDPFADSVIQRLDPSAVAEGREPRLKLYGAHFGVAGPPGVREATPHLDWEVGLPRGAAFSLITPLRPFSCRLGGGLEYWPTGGVDVPSHREPGWSVRYAVGEAVVFDGGSIVHRTQPFYGIPESEFPAFGSEGRRLRVIVQLLVALSEEGGSGRWWPSIRRSLLKQSTGWFRGPLRGDQCQCWGESGAASLQQWALHSTSDPASDDSCSVSEGRVNGAPPLHPAAAHADLCSQPLSGSIVPDTAPAKPDEPETDEWRRCVAPDTAPYEPDVPETDEMRRSRQVALQADFDLDVPEFSSEEEADDEAVHAAEEHERARCAAADPRLLDETLNLAPGKACTLLVPVGCGEEAWDLWGLGEVLPASLESAGTVVFCARSDPRNLRSLAAWAPAAPALTRALDHAREADGYVTQIYASTQLYASSQDPSATVRPTARPLAVQERTDGESTGSLVWPGVEPLRALLPLLDVPGRRVLELGSGVGILGLEAARLGARVRLSDTARYSRQYLNLQQNVQRNAAAVAAAGGSAEVVDLDWVGTAFTPELVEDLAAEIVVGSDVLHVASLVPALLATIKRCMRPDGACYLSSQHGREGNDCVRSMCAEYDLALSEVMVPQLQTSWQLFRQMHGYSELDRAVRSTFVWRLVHVVVPAPSAATPIG